jgi:predicted transcriptional regulator
MVMILKKIEKNGKRRGKLDIDLDVLEIVKNPTRNTKIMSDSNQSWEEHVERMEELEKDCLIEKTNEYGEPDKSGKFYTITDKGLVLINVLEFAKAFYTEGSGTPIIPEELKKYLSNGNEISIHEPESAVGSRAVRIGPATKYRQTI